MSSSKQIEALALRRLHGVVLGSLLGKALLYVTAQWRKLQRYVEDGPEACDSCIPRVGAPAGAIALP